MARLLQSGCVYTLSILVILVVLLCVITLVLLWSPWHCPGENSEAGGETVVPPEVLKVFEMKCPIGEAPAQAPPISKAFRDSLPNKDLPGMSGTYDRSTPDGAINREAAIEVAASALREMLGKVPDDAELVEAESTYGETVEEKTENPGGSARTSRKAGEKELLTDAKTSRVSVWDMRYRHKYKGILVSGDYIRVSGKCKQVNCVDVHWSTGYKECGPARPVCTQAEALKAVAGCIVNSLDKKKNERVLSVWVFQCEFCYWPDRATRWWPFRQEFVPAWRFLFHTYTAVDAGVEEPTSDWVVVSAFDKQILAPRGGKFRADSFLERCLRRFF